MIADRFWELLSKQVFAEANEAELREFEEFLVNQPHLKDIAGSLTSLAHQSLPVEKNNETEKAFQNHIKRIRDAGIEFNAASQVEEEKGNNNPLKRETRKWFFLAGVVSVILLIFFIYKFSIVSSAHTPKSQTFYSQVTTKPASKTQVQLPDGSIVWLNAISNLTYDKDFGKDLREVNLVGEGFFNVVKDAAHPFVIHTKVLDVKVLGTEFNVKAYPNDAYTETSLIRGSVEVTVKNRPKEKHYLKPNEKMSVANNILDAAEKTPAEKSKPIILTEPLTYYHVDSTIVETSWVENKLIFQENETFREVALKMERWYGVHISFNDDEVAEIRPFGSFTNETITQALDALRESFRFNYRINGENIIITK